MQFRPSSSANERAAYHILLQAIEVPMRTLLSNAGYAPEDVLAQIIPCGPDYGFDVTRGQAVEVKCEPIKPAPPVTAIFINSPFNCLLSFLL